MYKKEKDEDYSHLSLPDVYTFKTEASVLFR